MARPCVTCAHPSRSQIEAEILSGRSIRSIAKAHSLDHTALTRHAKNHLPASLQASAVAQLAAIDAPQAPTIPVEIETSFTVSPPRAIDIGEAPSAPVAPVVPTVAAPGETLAELTNFLRARTIALLARAEAAEDGKLTIAAIRELRGLVDTLAKYAPSDIAAAVPIASQPEWQLFRSTMLAALEPYPEARLAVAVAYVSLGAME